MTNHIRCRTENWLRKYTGVTLQILLISLTSFMGGNASAQSYNPKQGFCDQYARRAITQFQEAQHRNCGYADGHAGVGWHANYNAHYNWCMNGDERVSNSHTQIRNNGLNNCGARPPIDHTPPPGGQGMYIKRWDKIAGPGGGWSTGWVTQPNPYCGHFAVGCACGNINHCGWHPNGAQVLYWPNGCNQPAWTLRCTTMPAARGQ